MVDFKYKVTDIAKDFGISTKKVIETFAELTGEMLRAARPARRVRPLKKTRSTP